jgi:hypothetical protein
MGKWWIRRSWNFAAGKFVSVKKSLFKFRIEGIFSKGKLEGDAIITYQNGSKFIYNILKIFREYGEYKNN